MFDGMSVGDSDGDDDGADDGDDDGATVGMFDGMSVGESDGDDDGTKALKEDVGDSESSSALLGIIVVGRPVSGTVAAGSSLLLGALDLVGILNGEKFVGDDD